MPANPKHSVSQTGFTLIELVMVIVILGVVAAFALPRFADLSSDARLAAIDAISGTMKSSISIVKSKAYAQGLSRASSNPGGIQNSYIVETEAGRSEVDWRNLCPESRAEAADTLTMLDFISVDDGSTRFQTSVDNRFTRVGFDLSTNPAQSCYVEYDSFGDPECTVTEFVSGC